MSNLDNKIFYDLDGNTFTVDFENRTATLYGSHFHGVVPMAILSTTGLWIVAFVALLVAYNKILIKSSPGDRAQTYLRWPIMGLSTFVMIIRFIFDFVNRILHEVQLTQSWPVLILPVIESIAYGLAQGLLIAFLLWQFTPLLLTYAKVSEKRQKVTMASFKGLVFLIGLLDIADTIWSIVIYIIQVVLILRNQKVGNYRQSTNSLERAYNIGAGPVDVTFHALYFICVFAFAVVACITLQTEHKGKTLDRSTRIYLPMLTISIVLRSALELVWSLVFNLIYDFRHINLTPTSRLIQNVLYGFLSVVVYASILGITAHNDPRDVDVRHDVVAPPEGWDDPSCLTNCFLFFCGCCGVCIYRPKKTAAQTNDAQSPMNAAAHGTSSKQMDASGSYVSVPPPQHPRPQYDNGRSGYVPPPPLHYGVPPQSFEPGQYYRAQRDPQWQ